MSEAAANPQDAEHLRLLGIFHYVVAGMLALFACIPFIHFFVGIVMVIGSFFAPNQNEPTFFVGMLFVALAGVIIFMGWLVAGLLAYAGRCLDRRQHYTFCFVMAAVACFFMPVGTALGVFTIIVLSRPSVKAVFESKKVAAA